MTKQIKIVLTGVESSGKTTLAQQLATALKGTFVAEYARAYLQHKKTYTQLDLLHIAKGQLEATEACANEKLLFCDTDLQVIKIWSEVKYKTVDAQILDWYHNHLPDLYILCEPDFEWVYDPLRENEYDRERIHEMYVQELKKIAVPVLNVSGNEEKRKKTAVTYIRNHFCL